MYQALWQQLLYRSSHLILATRQTLLTTLYNSANTVLRANWVAIGGNGIPTRQSDSRAGALGPTASPSHHWNFTGACRLHGTEVGISSWDLPWLPSPQCSSLSLLPLSCSIKNNYFAQSANVYNEPITNLLFLPLFLLLVFFPLILFSSP